MQGQTPREGGRQWFKILVIAEIEDCRLYGPRGRAQPKQREVFTGAGSQEHRVEHVSCVTHFDTTWDMALKK